MKLEDYLSQQYSKKTVVNYLAYITKYLTSQPSAKAATYQEILAYIGKERKRGLSAQSLNTLLQAIKKYYAYLSHTHQREDHPCRYLYLKDSIAKSLQLQDLFTSKELELLLEKTKEVSHQELYYRNQLMISLLIYQGLKREELLSLKLKDINLEQGNISIAASAKSNARVLRLEVNQVFLFQSYIQKERPSLIEKLKRNRKSHGDLKAIEEGILILTLFGTVEKGRGVPELTEALKTVFKERNLNPITIRQSVIANKLKEGQELRLVQAFAGHKKISTTERYRQTDLEELKNGIEKYHPLG